MSYFVERFPRVQFIIASDDIKWCCQHLTVAMFNKLNTANVNITFSVKHNAAQDLALLARCNHTVVTTGSFSWWAAWLANGITIYYAKYPTRRTLLGNLYLKNDYYPPHWIAIDDPR